MERNGRLGRTGLFVTRLGLGLAALGRPGYINLGHGGDFAGGTEVAAMEQRAHDVLDSAFARGIRYFDVARSCGKAESFLASWLERRRIEPSEVTVGSKWGYTYTADWRIEADRCYALEKEEAVIGEAGVAAPPSSAGMRFRSAPSASPGRKTACSSGAASPPPLPRARSRPGDLARSRRTALAGIRSLVSAAEGRHRRRTPR